MMKIHISTYDDTILYFLIPVPVHSIYNLKGCDFVDRPTIIGYFINVIHSSGENLGFQSINHDAISSPHKQGKLVAGTGTGTDLVRSFITCVTISVADPGCWIPYQIRKIIHPGFRSLLAPVHSKRGARPNFLC
jgi:hypothetical protein